MLTFRDLILEGAVDTDVGRVPLDSNASLGDAEMLCNRSEGRSSALEIGFAYGASALAMLEGMGSGTLISVDPSQATVWNNGGLRSVQRAGCAGRHTLIEEPDFLALPTLLRDRRRFDLAYIDGWHSFDFVLLDVFYVDRLLDVGGLVGLNDCDWPAIRKALRFIATHMPWWEPIDSEPRRPGLRRIKDQIVPPVSARDRYFRKTSDTKVPFDFFANF